jgi:hypothetical protein
MKNIKLSISELQVDVVVTVWIELIQEVTLQSLDAAV